MKKRRKRRDATNVAAGRNTPRTISNEDRMDKDGSTAIDQWLNMLDNHCHRVGAGDLVDMPMTRAIKPKSYQRLKDDTYE